MPNSNSNGRVARTWMTVLAIAAALSIHHPVAAQSDAALEQVAEGWGRGEWVLLAHVMVNPETGRWEAVEDSPWAGWTVRRVGPRSVEYATKDGYTAVVEFSDGVYRDSPIASAGAPGGEPSESTIVEHGIFGPENWRILILFSAPPGMPSDVRYYSELVVAGDVFIWTNWIEDADGVRRRVMYSASQLADG